jgi:hypothetical protein
VSARSVVAGAILRAGGLYPLLTEVGELVVPGFEPLASRGSSRGFPGYTATYTALGAGGSLALSGLTAPVTGLPAPSRSARSTMPGPMLGFGAYAWYGGSPPTGATASPSSGGATPAPVDPAAAPLCPSCGSRDGATARLGPRCETALPPIPA